MLFGGVYMQHTLVALMVLYIYMLVELERILVVSNLFHDMEYRPNRQPD